MTEPVIQEIQKIAEYEVVDMSFVMEGGTRNSDAYADWKLPQIQHFDKIFVPVAMLHQVSL